ncbi:MAG: hypothetical protein LUH10_01330 [Tannerellaceae bacterium]|nr:hypothetical protein [Tannerellaceae bacterium]
MNTLEILKEALSASGIEQSGYNNSIVYFDIPCEIAEDGVLHGMFEIDKEEDLQKFQPEHLKKIIENITKFEAEGRILTDKEEQEYQAFLDEQTPEDLEELPVYRKNAPLNDITLYPDGSFRIGYNNGEGPAGTDFSYVYFSADFERKDEVIHEIY